MGINLSNFLSSKSKNAKMIDFQDLDHVDGVSISVVSANLYNDNRDDLSMFYFSMRHHITSRHVTSHHITSHHITLHYITSHHITSRHITQTT